MSHPQKPQRTRWIGPPELLDESHTSATLYATLNDPQLPYHNTACEIVDTLLEKGLTPEVIQLYNQRAEGITLSPKLLCFETGDGYRAEPDIQWTPDVMHALMRLLCSKVLISRLKKCPECSTYFFDHTKRNNAIYDTRRCAGRVRMRRSRTAKRAAAV